jgi:hypothetical protein
MIIPSRVWRTGTAVGVVVVVVVRPSVPLTREAEILSRAADLVAAAILLCIVLTGVIDAVATVSSLLKHTDASRTWLRERITVNRQLRLLDQVPLRRSRRGGYEKKKGHERQNPPHKRSLSASAHIKDRFR